MEYTLRASGKEMSGTRGPARQLCQGRQRVGRSSVIRNASSSLERVSGGSIPLLRLGRLLDNARTCSPRASDTTSIHVVQGTTITGRDPVCP